MQSTPPFKLEATGEKSSLRSQTTSASDSDSEWMQIDFSLENMGKIISEHFNLTCTFVGEIGRGSSARCFRYALSTGLNLVAKIILPRKGSLKTEIEVATMTFLKERTSIPIPKVRLYCGDPGNPVKVERILMDFVFGEAMSTCFNDLDLDAKRKSATDIAVITHTLFSITSSHCGVIMTDESASHRSLAYDQVGSLKPSQRLRIDRSLVIVDTQIGCVGLGRFSTDVLEDFAPNPYPNPLSILPSRCGPFTSEKYYLETLIWRGGNMFAESAIGSRAAYEKLLLIWEGVRQSYESSLHWLTSGSGSTSRFHLSHGDLAERNIILDPSTGAVNGLIDWELAAFYPAWKAASTRTQFNDDCCRFMMQGDQLKFHPPGYSHDAPEDGDIRNEYLDQIRRLNPELHYHDREGVELRALVNNMGDLSGNAKTWLSWYSKQWDTERRGPFPFDYASWKSWSVMDVRYG